MTTRQYDGAHDSQRIIAELRQERDAALAQKAALAEVLDLINHSPGDAGPIFEVILEKARSLCGADLGTLMVYDGEYFRSLALHGYPDDLAVTMKQGGIPPSHRQARLVRGERFVHIPDLRAVEMQPDDQGLRVHISTTDVRTFLLVPLHKHGTLKGLIGAHRREVRPFTNGEIALLESFAAQAVIAIENTRLLTEQREALEQQTATAEVLQVINASPGNLVPVFEAVLERALRLCGASFGTLLTYDGGHIKRVALLGVPPAFAEWSRRNPLTRNAALISRGIESGKPVQATDVVTDAFLATSPGVRDALVELGGVRALLQVPLLKDGAVVGFIAIFRRETGVFPETQIALIEGFAAQAVIAMENARLINEIRAARDAAEEASRTIEAAFRDLKAAQANLIQAEKMASLGQLTAGIAHEIKNPLNFVNNFSALSAELIDELRDVLIPQPLGDTVRREVDDLTALLKGNLEKVVQHGQRADGIVKAMLEHSRGSSAERRMVDLNALADEALNLAYHGARAQDQSFNITLERDFGERIAPIEVNPQDMTRVFLNVFSNGFYAATRRARDGGYAEFVPTLKVATRDSGEAVEIRVRDNGTGIPAEIRDKLFQPFFTTKPTGEGTGLGLSITYDIVTKQHGGTISVDSEVGEFTEFVITLPRNRKEPLSERSVVGSAGQSPVLR